MAADIVKIDPVRPEHAFSRCRDVLRSGGLIVYPTDTFYALGADPGNPASVKRLFEIKGRQGDQPILLLIKDETEVQEWVSEVSPQALHLMKKFWPGPLTLVFPAAEHVLRELTASTGTIGLRVPGNPLTRKLLGFLGMPLTGTSANISGRPSPRSADDAKQAVGDMVDLILDGGETTGGEPSTVVNVSTGHVIRRGAVEL